MLIVFFNMKEVAYYEFVLEGQTVSGALYLEIVRRLNTTVNEVRPAIERN